MTTPSLNIVECHGRLCRSDGRPANPGTYRLYFSLHRERRGAKELWAETLDGVDVAPGGFYHIILGSQTPFPENLFRGNPVYLATRVVRGDKIADESTHRVPVIAHSLQNGTVLADIHARLSALEEHLFTLGITDKLGNRTRRADRGQYPGLLLSVSDLLERLARVEAAGDRFESGTESRLEALETRADDLDDESTGRVTRIEDELDDIIGPDGDVVDLNERMDRLEGVAGLAELSSTPAPSVSNSALTQLEQRVMNIEAIVADLPDDFAPPTTGGVTAESLRVVKRSGDTMTGGLTINRGGLDVKSGGISARSGTLSSLSVESALRAERVVTSGVELRGDLTVDNPHRVVQVRGIEGRQGSSRDDGPLHLNARGGHAVVVGNSDEGNGMVVHGQATSDNLISRDSGWAEVFQVSKKLIPGTVVRITDGGKRKVDACRKIGDSAVVGVVVEGAGITSGYSTGGNPVRVALFGTAICCAEADSGEIKVGDLLTTSNVTGHARRTDGADLPEGSVLGKALGPLKSGRGVIPILVMVR